METFARAAKISDIPVGSGKVVEVSGKSIAVFNCDGAFYAIENSCKHRGGPLGEGTLTGKVVTCPWHGWAFNVASGACEMNPAITVQTFAVKIEGEDLLVSLSLSEKTTG